MLASIRYRANPLVLPNVLLVMATENRDRQATTEQWRRLIGPGLTIISHDGDHMGMIRQPNAFSLARKIEAWLADTE